MWARKSYHQCASEIEQTSKRFKEAYLNGIGLVEEERQRVLIQSSIQGVDVLRVLAGAIRSEQDAGMITRNRQEIGVFRKNCEEGTIAEFIRDYHPPLEMLADFEPLDLREALNKIVHANPSPGRHGFFVDDYNHDLLLSGEAMDRKSNWLCVISLPRLCDAIRSLPDKSI